MEIGRENIHSKIYAGALVLLAVSMPFSTFGISISEIILLLNWVIEGNLKGKIFLFSRNKVALALSSIFLLHLVGLLYTSDFNYGLEDVRKKIPILLLPLIISTSKPIGEKAYKILLKLFITSVFAGTLVCTAVLFGIIPHEVTDIRDISIFMSHIRFSLMISLAIFVSGYFIATEPGRAKFIFYLIITWLFAFLIILESLTGLFITVLLTLITCLFYAFQQPKLKFRIAGVLVVLIFVFFSAVFIKNLVGDYKRTINPQPVELGTYTPYHNLYVNDTVSRQTENGNLVWVNVCEKELKEAWNKRSDLDYDGKDLRGNELKITLIRFLASKGVRKDGATLNSLSNDEISSIESGVANSRFQERSSLSGRLYEVTWEIDQYKKGGNPTGHSITQRFEFWKAALGIIKDHPLIGVGTGDAKMAYADQYNKMRSPLDMAHRLRAHNQFLAISVALGIIGLLIFLFSLLYPLFLNNKFTDYFYLVFFVIVFVSMFTEDTLETQAGVTFFAFFNSLFLFASPLNFPLRKSKL